MQTVLAPHGLPNHAPDTLSHAARSYCPCYLCCLVLSCLVLSLCVSAQLRVAAVGLVKEMLKDRDPSTAGTRRQPASQPASQSVSQSVAVLT